MASEKKSKNTKLIVKGVIITVLVAVLVTFILLKSNASFCDFWTKTFTKYWEIIFGTVNKHMPFSVTEIFFIFLAVGLVTLLVFAIIKLVKKKYRKSLNIFFNFVLILLSVFTSYQLTAEMAYGRSRPNFELYETKVEKTEFRQVVEYFIADLKVCCLALNFKEDGDLIEPYDLNNLNRQITEEYANYKNDYLLDYSTYTKPMISSFIYREFHITGVTFVPLGEANVNTMGVAAGKPYTALHELAHTKGAMREEDSDLFAAILALNSKDPYLRYSGYYYTFSSLMTLARYTGVETDYNELYNSIPTAFLKNLSFNSNYWKEHNKAREFGNWMNDIYLKISGQSDGTGSYGDTPTVVDREKMEITSFSNFQKLYFKIYYTNKSN